MVGVFNSDTLEVKGWLCISKHLFDIFTLWVSSQEFKATPISLIILSPKQFYEVAKEQQG